MIDLSAFSFDVSALNLNPKVDFVARIPAGIFDRDILFDVFSRQLQFPAYFGKNWDALSECLRGLSWIERRRVVLIHEDVPALGAKQVTVYLEVLSECIGDWKEGEEHQLAVVFPPNARGAISELIAQKG